jgi:hypothetical protein
MDLLQVSIDVAEGPGTCREQREPGVLWFGQRSRV